MKQLFFLLTTCIGFTMIVNAQQFEWGDAISGASDAMIMNLRTAAAPSGQAVFHAGYLSHTAVFNPDNANVSVSAPVSASVFVTKYSEDGGFLWVKLLTGSGALGSMMTDVEIAADASENSYIIGSFTHEMDCDPGIGVFTLTEAAGYRGRFLVKLDPDGNFVWAQKLGRAQLYTPDGIGIFVRGNSVYCTGTFRDQYDFDNGPGVHTLTAPDACDVFAIRLNTDGAFQWAVNFGAVDNTTELSETGTGIAADASGNVYVSGIFFSAGDFDPGTGVETLTPQGATDAFVVKFNPNGIYQWAERVGGVHHELSADIEAATNGTVYISGNISDIPGEEMNQNMYVAACSGQGTLLWRHEIGAPFTSIDNARGLTSDASGSVYVSGYYESSGVDFDPGAGIVTLPASSGPYKSFLLKLDPSGNLSWVGGMQGAAFISGLDYNNGFLYGSGTFHETLDLDMGNGSNTIVNGRSYSDGFVWKSDTTGISPITGIEEPDGLSFSLYPNPAQEQLTIVVADPGESTVVHVCDLAGKILFSQSSVVSQIDVAGLSPGMYVLELRQNGLSGRQKFLKE